MRARHWLMILALAVACDDPAGVCDASYACEVPGVDLALVRAELANPVATDAASGLAVVPRDLRVRYTVRNRGSVASASRWLRGTLPLSSSADSALLPPLEPGDSVTGELQFSITAPYLVVNALTSELGGGATAARLSVPPTTGERDWESENDTTSTAQFLTEVATLELRVSAVPVPRVRVNESFTVRVSAYNRSQHEALPALPIAICMWEEDLGCEPSWGRTLTGSFTLPALAPGDSLVQDRSFAIAPTAVWQERAGRFSFTLAVLPPGWSDPYAPAFDQVAYEFGSLVRVRPDYAAACSPPVLHLGESATFSAYNCGILPETSQVPSGQAPGWYNQRLLGFRFHLVAVELLAGQQYHLESAAGASPSYLRDAEGEPAGTLSSGKFSVPKSGRYYLVLYGQSPALTVTLGQP